MSAQALFTAWRVEVGLFLVLVTALVAFLGVKLAARRLQAARDPRHALARTALDGTLVLAIALVLAATLVPTVASGGVAARDTVGHNAVNLVPLQTISDMLRWGSADQQWANLVLNILLFVPLGWTLALKARTRAPLVLATLGGAVTSLLVEAGQYVLPLSRSTDVDDVLLNTAGAAVGAAIAVVVLPALRWLAHSPRTRHRATTA